MQNQAYAMRDVRHANFRLIEKELYHYQEQLARISQFRDDIILGTSTPEVKVQSDPGDSTSSKAVKLASGVLTEVTKRVLAIEWACNMIKRHPEPGRWRLVQLKYFDGRLTNDGVIQELTISPDTFYRWRRDFIQLIADRLGWEI